jgi:hypoxanthine phosphoribosyltransferase
MSEENEERIFRTPWNQFPDVIVQTTVSKLKSLPEYDNAKRGNGEAAFAAIGKIIKPEKVPFSFDAVVPVAQFDRDFPNALPFAYAIQLAKHFDADLGLGILQSNVVSHTGADAETRILGQPVYIGRVEAGSRILIVDDVVTYGSTLANLRGWIEKQGATVVGATTLAAGFGATKLALPEPVYDRLVERFPIHAEKLANELGFTAECFTNREARFLCGIKQVQDIEALIATASEMKRERSRQKGQDRQIA